MDYLPIFADLNDRPVLVVGGGQVGERKIRILRKAGAAVTLIAPVITHALRELASRGDIRWLPKSYDNEDLSAFILVYAATNNALVNRRLYELGKATNTLVNAVDDKAHCSFISPAIVDRSPVVIAISTGGASPVLARNLRGWLERELPQQLGRVARFAERLRERVKEMITQATPRRLFWEQILDSNVKELLLTGKDKQAEAEFEQQLICHHRDNSGNVPVGHVAIVGAGPGDAGLLTLNALQAMQTADVILHDRLVSSEVLDLCRRDADLIDVGKRVGNHRLQQGQINTMLVDLVLRGKRVVRLKGGDPFVFGRGGEELLALAEHGLDADVIPGISAASACAATLQLPLTHRNLARSVTFVTAHCQKSMQCIDWASLGGRDRTLAFYMGIGQIRTIQTELLNHQVAGDTPWAIIENGTRRNQRVIFGRLERLAQTVDDKQVIAPALLIVGEVALLPGRLNKLKEQFHQPGRNPIRLRATA